MPFDDEFETFWKSHEMARSVATAGLEFARDVFGPTLYGPPSNDPALERFRQKLQAAYIEAFAIPDEAPKPRPNLRIVN